MQRKINQMVVVVFLLFSCPQFLFGQNWSSEQSEVWAGVEEYWKVSSSGDVEGFLKYFDDSYTGWSYNSNIPQSKENTSKWIKHDMMNNSNVLYTLTPITIWVKGDFAYVNYFYAQLEKDKEGKEKPTEGHWTDILMKKNGKWILIGDRGGRTSKDK
jgi:ketosteroid isomerase-like protein